MMKLAKAIALGITIPAICMAVTTALWAAAALPLSGTLTVGCADMVSFLCSPDGSAPFI